MGTISNPFFAPLSAGGQLAGGGGYGSVGYDPSGRGGDVYGAAPLDQLYPGSGGGLGLFGNYEDGGDGGGVVYILAKNINLTGSSKITGSGADGATGGGGAGSGGSIRIEADTITSLNTVSALGGTSGYGYGRIAVYYWSSLGSHTFSPTAAAYTKDLGAATAIPTTTPTVTITPTVTRTPTPTSTPSATSMSRVLLHMDGTDGSTTFTDVSGKTWTRSGNTQIDTAQSKFGGASAKFDGTGDDISTADSADFDFGSGDFTIDFWVRFNALPTSENAVLYSQAVDAGNRIYLGLVDSSGVYHWIFHVDSANTAIINVDSSTTIAAATWYHIAIVRSGSSFMIFQNGIQRGTTVTDTSAIPDFAAVVRISTWDGTNTPFNGWLDDYRVSKGIARWTSNFVPGATSTPTVTPTVTITLTSTPTGAKKLSYTYPTATGTATAARPHAVSSVADLNHPSATPDTYSYDSNGNMSQRTVSGVTTNFKYNADNRLYEIDDVNNAAIATFAYDGDGVKVSQTVSGTTTLYFAGGAYEVSGSSVKKYYSVGGATILDDGSGLKYILTDQQGSSVAVLNSSGALLSEQRYLPFGQVRNDLGSSISQTDFGYTGQKSISGLNGLMDYKFRMYDASIGRFISPDNVIPGAGNPQAFNRYTYVLNSPTNHTDPTGHECHTVSYGGYLTQQCTASPVITPTATPTYNGPSIGPASTKTSTPTRTPTSTPTSTSTNIGYPPSSSTPTSKPPTVTPTYTATPYPTSTPSITLTPSITPTQARGYSEPDGHGDLADQILKTPGEMLSGISKTVNALLNPILDAYDPLSGPGPYTGTNVRPLDGLPDGPPLFTGVAILRHSPTWGDVVNLLKRFPEPSPPTGYYNRSTWP